MIVGTFSPRLVKTVLGQRCTGCSSTVPPDHVPGSTECDDNRRERFISQTEE